MDTSCALRSIFTEDQDAGVDAQAAEISKINRSFFSCSALTLLEVPSGLRSRLRAKQLSKSKHARLSLKWEKSAAEQIVFIPLGTNIIQSALSIMIESKIQCRLRSLDCIEFASFLALRHRFSTAVLFTANFALCSLAIEHSVSFFNPLAKA
jgi:hypothetical protein